VLVETGHAGLDQREFATPDATVPDLDAAVTFILEHYPRLLSYCRPLAAKIDAGSLVFIGGAARSGKTTFAGILRDALLELGRSAVILSVDRWLRSEAERQPGVMGRYDVDNLKTVIETLRDCRGRPGRMALPGYRKLDRKSVPAVVDVPVSSADVILIEGMVALALVGSGDEKAPRYYVDIVESQRKQRVLDEYRLLGYSLERALSVYLERQEDELAVINDHAPGATRLSFAEILNDH
jgi:uridine kinase